MTLSMLFDFKGNLDKKPSAVYLVEIDVKSPDKTCIKLLQTSFYSDQFHITAI